jgi:ABC-type Mn2+/Zn2+ transport system ATPase subunit
MSQLDRLLLLNQRLIADGLPAQVMTTENLQQAYCGQVIAPKTMAADLPFC